MTNIEKIKKYLKSIKTKKQDGKLEVKISVMAYDDHRCGEKIRVELRDVVGLLTEKNIKHGKCVQAGNIQNKRRNISTWVFKDIVPAVSETKTTNRRRNSRKSKKNLDNFKKDVIIKEETNNNE